MTMIGEHKMMGSRVIDSLTHRLTGVQLTYCALYLWQHDPDTPVWVWAERGDTESKVRMMRIAISKHRNAKKSVRRFSITKLDTWPYTLNGIKGEVVGLQYAKLHGHNRFMQVMRKEKVEL